MSSLNKLNYQSSGILIKAVLIIQAVSSDKLQAILTVPKFARIHKQLSDFDSQIPDEQLYYHELSLSGKPFEIVVKKGIIRELLVDKDVSIWELNLLKGIVSQLQVDTQGENALHDHSTQESRDEQYFASFETMEDTVGGNCEVLYDISPLSPKDLFNSLELAPMIHDKRIEDQVQLIDVRKTKNYNNCNEQRGYYFGLSSRMSLKQGSNINEDSLTAVRV